MNLFSLDNPTWIVAEVSANHNQSLELALALVEAAANSGADAVKFQTHIAESETLASAPAPAYFSDEPRVAYFRRTAFTLADRAAGRNVVQPGAVAVVRHYDGGVAVEVRVVPAPKPKFRTDRAIIDTATRTVLVVRLTNGSGLPLAIDGATRVYLPKGRRGGPELLQAGYLVDVVYDPAGSVPVQSVRVIRRVS